MKVRDGEIQVATLLDLRDLAHDGFTVARTQASVHDQRALRPDDDADVGNKRDTAVGDRVDVFGDFLSHAFLDERWLLRTALRQDRCDDNAGGNDEDGGARTRYQR